MADPQLPLSLTLAAERKLAFLVDGAITKAIIAFRESTTPENENPRFVKPEDRYDEDVVRAVVGLHLARTAAKLGSDIIGAGAFEAKIKRLEDAVDDLTYRVSRPITNDDSPGDLGRCPAPSVKRIREELAAGSTDGDHPKGNGASGNGHIMVDLADNRIG